MTDSPNHNAEDDLFSHPANDETGYERWRASRKQQRADDLLSLSEDESGYERWRAEAKAEIEHKPANASELPITNDGSGYDHWRKDMDEARLEFERQWGVPVGHRVRVHLRDDDVEHEGLLNVVERITPTKKHGLMLQLGGRQFRAAELMSVVRV